MTLGLLAVVARVDRLENELVLRLHTKRGYGLKKRLPPGDFPRHPNTMGPDNKKTVTKHAHYSIRGHPAFISWQTSVCCACKKGVWG